MLPSSQSVSALNHRLKSLKHRLQDSKEITINLELDSKDVKSAAEKDQTQCPTLGKKAAVEAKNEPQVVGETRAIEPMKAESPAEEKKETLTMTLPIKSSESDPSSNMSPSIAATSLTLGEMIEKHLHLEKISKKSTMSVRR